MSKHINQRIASLREAIKSGLHQDNLDRIVSECNTLAQDTSFVLTFFVLKQVFSEMSAALDGEAVTSDQYQDLISEIVVPVNLTLDKIERNERIEANDLEAIVRIHVRNLNVFRSDR